MQFESLKIFCDVVRTASFSRGAVENGISQSSASQAVQHLEERLGLKLIDRSKRPLVLTQAGKVYYDGCRDLVERYQELENRVQALDDLDAVAGTVGVAAIYSGLHSMSRYVKAFEERYDRANVRLEYLHPKRVVERVTSGEAELGLLSYPKKWPDLTVRTWREETMVLVVDPAHRLANRTSVPVSELAGEPFIAFDTELGIRRAIDRFLRRHEVVVDVVLEFDNIETIKRAIEVPTGVSILPEPSLAHEIKAGTLKAIAIEGLDPTDRLTRPLAIIHRRQGCLERPAAKFLELLIGQDVTANGVRRHSSPTDAPPPGSRAGVCPRRPSSRTGRLPRTGTKHMHPGPPPAQGLYDPSNEHDSCAVGFIVNMKGKKSHQIVRDGITALVNMSHRGACGCENNTGDGAGLLIQVPHDFLVSRCRKEGIALPEPGQLWRGRVLQLARSGGRATRARSCSRRSSPRKGRAFWAGGASRPIRGSLGESARAVEPRMWHAFVGRGPRFEDADRFERKLYVIRKRFENEIRKAGLDDHRYFYFSSLSCRTLVYKGMLTSGQLGVYFADDLGDPLLSSALCMVHSRFSTNTFPSWQLAPSLPDDLSQRRDQHPAGEHQLDAGPRGALCLGPLRAGRSCQDQADHSRRAFRFGLPGQRRRAAGAIGLQPGARHDDADSRGVGKQRLDAPGQARLLPLS